jgi:hypothetical protein
MGYRLAMNAAIKMIFASRVVLFFSFTWTLIFPVNCETPPTSIVYPSATPTFDYHDTVVIVWITIWEETEVDIYCSQAAVYLPLYTASGKSASLSHDQEYLLTMLSIRRRRRRRQLRYIYVPRYWLNLQREKLYNVMACNMCHYARFKRHWCFDNWRRICFDL